MILMSGFGARGIQNVPPQAFKLSQFRIQIVPSSVDETSDYQVVTLRGNLYKGLPNK